MKTRFYAFICNVLLLGVAPGFTEDIRPLLERYCVECHGGEKVKGKVDFSGILNDADAEAQFELWETVADVVRFEEMPPEDEAQPTEAERQRILSWYEERFVTAVQARPGHLKPRRLSGPEYRRTLRSLFGFDLEVSFAAAEQTVMEKSLVLKLLPTDPPGASGFINDTHGARLSTVLWDQYAYLADSALDQLFSRHRREQLGVMTGGPLPVDFRNADFTSSQADALVRHFVPRAFRRPVSEERLDEIVAALDGLEGTALIEGLKTELKTVLMSPGFLYRGLLMEGLTDEPRPVDDFELAERLSYFLWEDMPDAELMEVAANGTLTEPEVYAAQIDRLLASPASRTLSESFGVQWLLLDEIDDVSSDPTRRHAFKSQPLDFLNYLFTEDRPVMELIDSDVAFANYITAGYYGKDRGQMEKYVKPKGIERQSVPNQRLQLDNAEGRGGLLTMPGVLAMNKGPILRGTWMLRRVLGEHLAEPPADVPAIEPSPPGKKLSFREQFEQHRNDASCARCHDKIDPLGFAMQAYDEQGGFMLAADYKKAGKSKGSKNKGDAESGGEIDTSGKLPTGETFESFEELKTLLLTSRREDIIRNAVERTLSYALCRRLEPHDRPAVDAITSKIHREDGTWRDLIHEVAGSLPFRETIIVSKKDS